MIKTFESQFKQQTPISPKIFLCTDLRTCGLFIAYFELVSAVLTFLVLGILFSFLKLIVGGSLLYGIYTKKPNLMVPFLAEHCFSIIGATISVIVLILKPRDIDSSDDQSYTTDITDEIDEIYDHKALYTIAFIIGIALSSYSWLVIFTLYKQYTIWQLTAIHGQTGPIAIAMQQNIATIENGYNPTYSRSKVGIQ